MLVQNYDVLVECAGAREKFQKWDKTADYDYFCTLQTSSKILIELRYAIKPVSKFLFHSLISCYETWIIIMNHTCLFALSRFDLNGVISRHCHSSAQSLFPKHSQGTVE